LDGCDPGRGLFVCGDGRTSAPTSPQRVQTIRAPSCRITISSGSESASSVAE
jgi:hypothetical protein